MLVAVQTGRDAFDWQGFALYAAGGIAIGIILSTIVRRLIDGFARRHAASVRSADPATIMTRYRLLERLATVVIFLIVALSVLSRIDAASGFVRAIFASTAVVTLIVGLAIRSPLANLGAGIQMLFTQPFRLGDHISSGELSGTVEELRLSTTVIRTAAGARVFLPNEQVIGQAVSNSTIADDARLVTIRVPVAHGEDGERAVAILQGVAADSELALAEPAPTITVAELDREGIWLELTVWAQGSATSARLASDLRLAAAARLAAAGIGSGASGA